MSLLNDMRAAIQEHVERRRTHKFIKSLDDERLDWLVMTPPLGGDILEHALTCERCAKKIVHAVDAATLKHG